MLPQRRGERRRRAAKRLFLLRMAATLVGGCVFLKVEKFIRQERISSV